MRTAETSVPSAEIPGSRAKRVHERSRAIEAGRRGDRLARAAHLVGVGLICAAAGYVAGRVHGVVLANEIEERVQQADARHRAAVEEADERARAIETHVAELADRVHLLESARRIALAQRALDARNFGIAEAELRHAERMFRAIASEAPEIEALANELASMHLVVAEDLASQRERLMALAERADALVPPTAPRE